MTTPNNAIPLVPENTTDPAAGLNLSLDTIDALLQTAVLAIQNDPPGSPADGDRYIVDVGTGAWLGEDDQLARYDATGAFWQFFSANQVLNLADSKIYINNSGWSVASGGTVTGIITPAGTAHTAVKANNGGLIIFDSASDCTLTVPQTSTEALDAGFHVLALNKGGGNLQLALEGTDTLAGVKLWADAAQAVTVVKETAGSPNAWRMIGNGWIPAAVEDDALTAPPATPAVGAVFIPAATATGSWATHENEFAIHLGSDAYDFVAPWPGAMLYEKTSAIWIGYNGAAWVAV